MKDVKDKIGKVRRTVKNILTLHDLPNSFGLGKSPVPQSPCGDGSPYLTYSGDSFTIIVEERGNEYERIENLSFDEAVRYYVFLAAQKFGMDYEVQNRKTNAQYSRWNWMKPIIDAMARVSPKYGEYAFDYYYKTLKNSRLSKSEIENSWFEIPKF